MKSRPLLLAFGVVLLGLGLTFVTVAGIRSAIDARAQSRFMRHAEQAVSAIESRGDTYIAMLRAGAGLFDIYPNITGADFRRFIERLELDRRYPGIQGVGFALRATPEDIPNVERRIRAEGFDAYTVHPASPVEERYPILYLEPLDLRNRSALGYDMFSNPIRRQAMVRARDTGLPAATGRVTLVQEITEPKQAGFLIYVPVYAEGGVPSTLEERRLLIRGFVYSPFRVDDFLRGVLSSRARLKVEFDVYDGPAIRGTPIHRSPGVRAEQSDALRMSRPIHLAGREWTVEFFPARDFYLLADRHLLWSVAGAGIFITVVLACLVWRENRARAQAEQRTSEFREASQRFETTLRSIGDAVVATDADHRVTFMNEVAERLCDYRLEEAQGLHIDMVFPLVEERNGKLVPRSAVQRLEESSSDTLENNSLLRSRTGALRPLDDSCAPIEINGVITGAVFVFRDTTERRAAESFLRMQAQVLDNMVEGVTVTDQEGYILYTNPAHDHIFGYAPGELVGKHVRFLTTDQEIAGRSVLERAMEALQEWGDWTGEFPHRRKDGRVILTRSRVSSVKSNGTVRYVCVQEDITEQKRAEAALRESEARFRNMADSAPVLIWLAGPDRKLTWVNKTWLDLVGRSLEEELGLGWTAGIHPHDVEASLGLLERAYKERKPFTTEFRIRRRDGAYRWLIANGVPLYDAAGEFTGYVGSCVDITSRHEIEEQKALVLENERKARAVAEHASRMKDEFLGTLSHELRTPLNAILGWAQLLQRAPLDKEGIAEAVETIARNARAQTHLIEDLLDMSRIISGKVRLDVAMTDVIDVAQAAIESVRLAAEAKGVAVQLLQDDETARVLGDSNRLQQVLWNLLTNAIKFTPRGGTVTVQIDHSDDTVRVRVTDTGRGIRKEFLPFVFERFRQEDSSTTRRYGGLGLGLSIVKQLVELHGGTIAAQSAGENQGATFTVELPAARQSTSPRPVPLYGLSRQKQHESVCPSPLLDGVRILIVDDEADARQLVQRILEECHAEVTTTACAGDALRFLQERSYDVLISDIGMPDIDGYELMRKVRSLAPSHGGNIPAIALTAFARSEDSLQALRAGYQAHIVKPVNASELIGCIREQLEGKPGQDPEVQNWR